MTKRVLGTTTLLLLVCAAARPQDPPEAATRDVRIVDIVRSGRSITVVGSCEMPDQTILGVKVVAEPEYIAHGREVRIMTLESPEVVADLTTAVERKKFSVKFEFNRVGYYRINVVYSRFSQMYKSVIQVLGEFPDTSWQEPLLLIDLDALPQDLIDHAAKVEEWIVSATQMEDRIEQELEPAKEWAKKCKGTLNEVRKRIEEAKAYGRVTPYNGCMDTVAQAFSRMLQFDPGFTKPNFAPGSAEEAMAAAMSADIPGDLSDEYLKKLIRAYLSRTRAALPRERILMPLRIVVTRWDAALARLKNAKAGDKENEAAQAAFEKAVACNQQNLDLIRKDKKLMEAGWEGTLKKVETVVAALVTYLADRRAAVSNEAKQELDAREKQVRGDFAAVNNALRTVPKQ